MENEFEKIVTFENLKKIFNRCPCHKIKSLNGLVKAKYPNENLHNLLSTHFGDTKLNDVNRALFIPAFAINDNDTVYGPIKKDNFSGNDNNADGTEGEGAEDVKILKAQMELTKKHEHLGLANAPDSLKRRCKRWHEIFYHNLIDTPASVGAVCANSNSAVSVEDDANSAKGTVVEAIMSSTAAPTYFPLVGNNVDGGVVHNNPSLAILSHLLALGVPMSEIYILSLGTGELPQEFNVKDDSSLGLVQWLPKILDMLMDANQEAISVSCYQILGERFHRISPLLSEEIALDSVSKYDEMVKIGESMDLSETFAWLNMHF